MSRLFDGVDDQIDFAVGASASLPTAALSTAFLVRLNSVHRGGLLDARDSGDTRRLGVNPFDNGDIFFAVKGFTSVGYAAFEDVFAIVGFSKPAGNGQTVRAHIYRYDTAAWAHTNLGTVDAGATLAGGLFRVGLFDAGQFLSANVCVYGLWAGTELNDATFEAAGLETSLGSWEDLTPTTLWAFNQASTADPVLDRTGGGADQTAITGTAVSADEPPGFSYSTASTATLDATLPALTAAVTGRAVARATAVATLPALTAGLAGDVTSRAALAATLPALTATITGHSAATAQLAATLPALTARFTDGSVVPAGRGAASLRSTGAITLLDRPEVTLR